MTPGRQTPREVRPVGRVRRAKYGVQLRIDGPYRPALRCLGHFSHVVVLWWAGRFDSDEHRSIVQVRPPYADKVLTGIFATRSPLRPNPIALSVCRVLDVDEDEGVVVVANIDAYDGTEIIDIKGYFPVTDRVGSPRIPGWLPPEFTNDVPDDGQGPE